MSVTPKVYVKITSTAFFDQLIVPLPRDRRNGREPVTAGASSPAHADR
jgi:hypothetical protein